MKPVLQTRVGFGGNCVPAVIASIFEIGLDEAPDLHPDGVLDSDEVVRQKLSDWALERGIEIVAFPYTEGYPPPASYVLAGVKSHSGDFEHAVVAKDGVVVHDPNPDKPEDAEYEFIDFWIFCLVDPSKHVQRA